ncbi:trichohyalin-like isoform X2 [Ostrea edulis]|uniref:trichohyalin-like isoform X2 n=1 Tax=Ostrea edulis TaxID=37623 RepID=UPI0024AF0657|nr:trichohyalin-like isoform X2 [Ostrea edulis]XP_056014937.1 trichohyalin-like isoform X2 [Ostrea edulis]
MAVPLIPKLKGIPTIFGEVLERNVTFCVDTSGSMYKGLDVVKEHLVETLLKQANKSVSCMFNIIEFNSEVTQWADKMVKCTPETVAVATNWVKNLSAKTGTNTQGALLTALSDNHCEAVYLVTDGLPDQHPADILDHVGLSGHNRPIHCIYLCSEDSTDQASVEFLEDLAVESFGSFHIITLTVHGCVERITPIYRSDHAHERIIRTVNGTIHNSTKNCGVSTTLMVDPEESLRLTPRVSLLGRQLPFMDPLGHPYMDTWKHWFLQPYRYYYPHGWSRYRPAKGWLKAQDLMLNSTESSPVCPAAGALLIGKRVLARRIDDGYFYMGTVQSQILSDKFLVAFGPCKHGKYKDTKYQDTFIYDIIDYEDAKRHTIQTGDKVLAPWEPEGERFCPGVIIEGQEKRQVNGPDDRQITVTFANGKTEKVPMDVAIWTPEQVYERLTLELKMPKEARLSLQNQEPNYPKENLEGYPTSGPSAEPSEYPLPNPFHFQHDPVFLDSLPWGNGYIPAYPPAQRQPQPCEVRLQTKSSVKSEDINKLVPGTNVTQKELDDKVVSQLVEHKLLLDERQTEKDNKEVEREEELKRREEERRMREEKMRMMEEERRKREVDMRLREEVEKRRAEEEEMAQRVRDEYEAHRRAAEEEYQKRREEEIKRMKEAEESARIKQERDACVEENVEDTLNYREVECLTREKEDTERSVLEERQRMLERERDKHRMRLEEIEREIEIERSRLLRKRDKQEENLLRKSVTFEDQLNEHDLEIDGDNRVQFQSRPLSDDEEKYREEFNFDKFLKEKGYRCNRTSFNPPRNSANFMRRRPRSADSRKPEWQKYWSMNSIPDIIDPPNHGAFRETALQAPLEARDLRRYPYACEWTTPVYTYVDPFAKSKCTSTVEQLMRTPKPPEGGYQPAPPVEIRGTRPVSADSKEAARREYRRVKVSQRNKKWNERIRNEQLMKDIMQDNHRERIVAQMERDRQRLRKEQETVEQAQKAKKYVSAELRAKMEKRELENKKKEQNRIEAMRQRREQRESAAAKKLAEEEKITEMRKGVRIQRSQQRWDNVHSRLQQEEAENQVQGERVRNAKINRIEHFQKLEEEGQQRKDIRIKVSDQHLALLRSQVFP